MNYDEVADDSTIRDECQLFRRISGKININIIWDHIIQCWRPSSASFNNHPNKTPTSIVIIDDLEKAGRIVTEVMIDSDKFALVAITERCAHE